MCGKYVVQINLQDGGVICGSDHVSVAGNGYVPFAGSGCVPITGIDHVSFAGHVPIC